MRYQINKVYTEYEAMKDAIRVLIYYTDNIPGGYGYDSKKGQIQIVMALNTFDAYSANDAAIADMICKKAAQEVEAPYDFYDAMRYYMKDMDYAGKTLFGHEKPKKSMYEYDYEQFAIQKKYLAKTYDKGIISWDEANKVVEAAKTKASNKKPSGSPIDFINQIDLLPGLDAQVTHPVTKNSGTIKDIIINLNDYHKWDRGAVADWLETLDVDLRFKSPDDRLREKKEKERQEKLDKLRASLKQATDKIKKFADEMEAMKIAAASFEEQIKQLLEEENGEN